MNINLSPDIELKLLDKHSVQRKEVEQCFYNRNGDYFTDTREEHKTDPLSEWFLARTDAGRLLKLVFICLPDRGLFIKTAYEANDKEIALYCNKSKLDLDDL
jgi:uncharacterized DUF497 family protein